MFLPNPAGENEISGASSGLMFVPVGVNGCTERIISEEWNGVNG